MSTIEAFAARLVLRSKMPLYYSEIEALSGDPFADVGPFIAEGNVEEAMRLIAEEIPSAADPYNLGRLLSVAGYLVERGASATIRLAPALARVVVPAARVAAANEQALDVVAAANAAAVNDPDGAAALMVCELALAGALTLLFSDRSMLRAARAVPEILEGAWALRSKVSNAATLADLIEASDHAKLVVLAPTLLEGIVVDADGVRNGFHMFTLLEGALMGSPLARLFGDGVPSAEEFALARNGLRAATVRSARAHLDFFNWSAWTAQGWAEDAPTRWVWGELPLRYIPRAYGEMVVLLEHSKYSRSWEASLGCALRADHHPNIVIERLLSHDDVSAWLAKLVAAPEVARQRMRYAGVKVEN